MFKAASPVIFNFFTGTYTNISGQVKEPQTQRKLKDMLVAASPVTTALHDIQNQILSINQSSNKQYKQANKNGRFSQTSAITVNSKDVKKQRLSVNQSSNSHHKHCLQKCLPLTHRCINTRVTSMRSRTLSLKT